MKFGIVPLNLGPFAETEVMLDVAQHAETLGYESAWTFEHVIIPYSYESKYPYHPSGKAPGADTDTNFIDPLIAISHMAAATSTLRFGTGVNILPQTNPLFLAKQATSIDYLSHGRFMLGLGAGWLREEFEALGVPFEKRGARTNDYLRALKAAWAEGETVYKSEFINWSGFHLSPRPVQKPGIPLIIGGNTKAAVRRVVNYGDGWFMAHRDQAHMQEQLDDMRAVAAAAGRDPGEIEITAFFSHTRETLDDVKRYEEMGVHRLIVNVVVMHDPDSRTALSRFADAFFTQA